METFNERSRTGWRFIPEDEDLRQFIPLTLRYRVHDKDTNTEMIAWTAVDPAEPGVVFPASANRILDDNNAYETRIITVQSDYDTDDQLSNEREYRIRNLSGFS